ncbi:MAG TPA: CSLREA domain-containing protein [Rudaea sp.]|nr:CSLREA domain-containing protein [Rudaea sp.]
MYTSGIVALCNRPRHRLRYALITFVPLAFGAFVPAASAARIDVNTATDAVAVDGQCSLREAITAVNKQAASGNLTGECAAGDGNDDTVIVPAGTYTLAITGVNENNNASGDLDILADIRIQGTANGATVIDANGIDRIIDIVSSAVTVRFADLKLLNGHAPVSTTEHGQAGGAVNNGNGATLVLSRVELANNESGVGIGTAFGFSGAAGGAIFSNAGSVLLVNCWLHDNHSGAGSDSVQTFGYAGYGGNGGALASVNATIDIETTKFDRNHTGDGGSGGDLPTPPGFGGAIYAKGGSINILQSAVHSNQTGTQATGGFGAGGGVFVANVTMQINQTSITNNVAFDGGGLDSGDSALTLDNVTLSGNYAGQFGGGLFMSGGNGQLNFVTLAANQAALDSGGARIENGSSGAATVSYRNTIVSGNFAPNQPDCNIFSGNSLISNGYNLAGAGCPADAFGDVATTNPQLGPLSNNGGIGLTLMPHPDGPAVDGGNCVASNIGMDERGHARFVDVPRTPDAVDACDIGAVELDDDIFRDGFR